MLVDHDCDINVTWAELSGTRKYQILSALTPSSRQYSLWLSRQPKSPHVATFHRSPTVMIIDGQWLTANTGQPHIKESGTPVYHFLTRGSTKATSNITHHIPTVDPKARSCRRLEDQHAKQAGAFLYRWRNYFPNPSDLTRVWNVTGVLGSRFV